jgi:hypothetical protein
MAIDTPAKRASALSVGKAFRLVPPDGTIDQADRQTISGLYGGILAASPIVVTLRNVRRRALKPRYIR